MSTDTLKLYIPLLNEGTDVLRPATGPFVELEVVRVDAPADYDPEVEEWAFPPSSVVRCVAEFRGGTRILLARSWVQELSHKH